LGSPQNLKASNEIARRRLLVVKDLFQLLEVLIY